MYINIHTHQFHEGEFEVLNLFPEEVGMIVQERYYSLGIHPWDVIPPEMELQLKLIEAFSNYDNVIAIGEIGLDKLKPNFELQTDIFEKQIDIAVEIEKPIIVHCVKAYSELLEILNRKELPVPMIIHRYSGNKTIAEQLIKKGCYLSFGHELFKDRSKVPSVFRSIENEHIFFETVDSELDIKTIYYKGAEIKGIKPEELILLIERNFSVCFESRLQPTM
jgi:TatD DNase family protein